MVPTDVYSRIDAEFGDSWMEPTPAHLEIVWNVLFVRARQRETQIDVTNYTCALKTNLKLRWRLCKTLTYILSAFFKISSLNLTVVWVFCFNEISFMFWSKVRNSTSRWDDKLSSKCWLCHEIPGRRPTILTEAHGETAHFETGITGHLLADTVIPNALDLW